MQVARFCDFCGKHQDYVLYMLAGPKVHICEECVEVCVNVIKESEEKKKEAKGRDE